DFSPLAGRDVIILPDNDEAGEKGADELIEMLAKVGAKRVRRWKAPAEAPPKWDIADQIPAELGPKEIVKSILEAPEPSRRHIVRTLSEFLADFVPPDYLIEGILQHHYFYTLTGMTGAGKTAVALLLAVLVARGGRLGSREVERGRVVYIARENP